MWCLPEDPSHRVAGTLSCVPTEFSTLRLMESLQPIPVPTSPGQAVDLPLGEHHAPIVWGLTTKGEFITLLNCAQTAFQMRLAAHHGMMPPLRALDGCSAEYKAIRVLIGAHFASPEDIRFRRLKVRFTHLEEWTCRAGLRLERTAGGGVALHGSVQSPHVLFDGDGTRVEVEWKIASAIPFRPVSKISVDEEAWIVITFAADQPLETCEMWVSTVRNFLAFAVMSEVVPLTIVGETARSRDRTTGDETDRIEIEVLITLQAHPQFERKLAGSMLFTLEDVLQCGRPILEAWIHSGAQVEALHGLYFSTLRGAHLYLSLQFMGFLQAIEAYVRFARPDPSERQAEHEEKSVQVLSTTAADLRSWLEEKLSFRSEMSLREKLQWALNEHAALMSRVIPDEPAFLRAVIDTRNFFTHFDERLKARAASGQALYALTEKLRLLTEICLLREIGFEHQQMGGFLMRSQRML
jgi:hypothetical protein